MKKELILKKIESAQRDIAAAQDELENALRDIQLAPRAEKTTISKVLETAFAKVKAARVNLSDLESDIAGTADD